MPRMKHSRHNLSHYRLATFDMGFLVPVACVEVLLGDSFVQSSSALVRASTLVAPVMHPVECRIHHWFVPNRVVWDQWDEFITGRDPELTVPTETGQFAAGSVGDHIGIPPNVTVTVNELPLRAYNKIWNEFYRDQDLQTERTITDSSLARVAWQKDYFTTARLSPQQGTAISIPFQAGTEAPVIGTGGQVYFDRSDPTVAADLRMVGDQSTSATNVDSLRTAGANDADAETGRALRLDADAQAGLVADLSNTVGGGIDVNEFRMAMAMQRHLEARNRWGSRIQDYLAYHGLRPQDSRLQLPEYLGGGKATIAFSEVLATAEGASTNVGDQAGHGIVGVRTRPYGRFFPESGWLLSLMSVRPRTMYADQLHRQFLRTQKDDYWQKEYEAFGPQAVLRAEVYADHGNYTDVFGYQGRHDEYRRHPSYVSGLFRTTDDHWHMARFFSSSPALNSDFVTCTPTDRIYADTSEPEVRVMVSHNIRARRLVARRARY